MSSVLHTLYLGDFFLLAENFCGIQRVGYVTAERVLFGSRLTLNQGWPTFFAGGQIMGKNVAFPIVFN